MAPGPDLVLRWTDDSSVQPPRLSPTPPSALAHPAVGGVLLGHPQEGLERSLPSYRRGVVGTREGIWAAAHTASRNEEPLCLVQGGHRWERDTVALTPDQQITGQQASAPGFTFGPRLVLIRQVLRACACHQLHIGGTVHLESRGTRGAGGSERVPTLSLTSTGPKSSCPQRQMRSPSP